MRAFLELVTIAVLLLVGWNRPFRQHAHTVAPSVVTPPKVVAPADVPASSRVGQPPATAPAPRDNSWMWEKGKLDRGYGKDH